MSTSGVRRLNPRGGAGGKITAANPNTKPVTPFSAKSRLLMSTTSSTNKSAAAEKPRSVSRGPATARASAEEKRRLSSVPRGRNNTTSCDFVRVSSVSHSRSSDSEVSGSRIRSGKGLSGFSAVRESETRFRGGLKENRRPGGRLGKESLNLSTGFVAADVGKGLNEFPEQSSVVVKSDGNAVDGLWMRPSVNVVEKYPSKLHEKLAFLEGKVKRIASDIKRTKEMLDMNNANADVSKVIICDIQEKISGIEKAVSCVVGETGRNLDAIQAKEEQEIELPGVELSSADTIVSYPIGENAVNLCNDVEVSKVEETEDVAGSSTQEASNVAAEKISDELLFASEEQLEEFDELENEPEMVVEEDNEEDTTSQIREIGRKASTGGWFVNEGESVLLVHDDGSCSLHDVANSEVKSEYKPPSAIASNIWSDCWIIRAPGADGCAGKYVVAASAGNTLESGFCSWDFYTKEVQAFHIEQGTAKTRSVLAPLQVDSVLRRNTLSTMMSTENRQWWYKPLGPLVVSTASFQKSVQIFDVRDGERIMRWNVQKPVLNMDYSSPVQWRNRGKVVIAEADAITLWDVGSLNPQALLSVPASGHKISALHVGNSDAEGGGVRQRTSSSDAEGHDGVFCTDDSINILDFRQPSGIGLKIPKLGVSAQSVFSRGDSVFLGCSSVSPPKMQCSSQVQLFSLRKQKLVSTYVLPESNAHILHASLTQVWGNSNLVMGVCGQGLFVFDALKDEGLPSFALDYCGPQNAREVIGPDDLYSPSFDYASSQVLLISRDRPAMFRYL